MRNPLNTDTMVDIAYQLNRIADVLEGIYKMLGGDPEKSNISYTEYETPETDPSLETLLKKLCDK